MANSTSEQLRFPTIAGMSIRANFDGGAMSSDFGALLVAGVDRQIGLTQRLANAFSDQRNQSYITHYMRDLLKQRIYQQATGYEDCNDSCLLYTSDAADDLLCVDLGGRRIIKK